MAFTLPPLPFDMTALEPHVSKKTLEYHYGKHHAGYVNKLNGMIGSSPFAGKTLEELIKVADGGVYNNAAQIWNHTFYWNSLAKDGGGEPTGQIKDQIEKDFGSVQKFKDDFSAVACGHFGSGWAWLVFNKDEKKLKIHGTHDAGNPIRDGVGSPILTCDVWEHAYYIDYQNDRPSYVKAWWNLVNWKFANKNLEEAMKN